MRFVNNFQVDECSIPEGMTIDEWRRSRARPRRSLRDRARVRRLPWRAGEAGGRRPDER